MMTRSLLFAAALLASALPAAAGPGGMTLSYAVHARGINAGVATYTFTFADGRYTGQSERKSTGLARRFVKGGQDFSYEVRGFAPANGPLQPVAYRHVGGKKRRVVQVAFTPTTAVTTAEPPMGMGSPPATPEQKVGVIDQVTMIAALARPAFGPALCNQTLRVLLDGRARFDVALAPAGTSNWTWKGRRKATVRCHAAFNPIAGFSDPQEPATLSFEFAAIEGFTAPVLIEMPTESAGVVKLQLTDAAAIS
jgi:hypothetical protein